MGSLSGPGDISEIASRAETRIRGSVGGEHDFILQFNVHSSRMGPLTEAGSHSCGYLSTALNHFPQSTAAWVWWCCTFGMCPPTEKIQSWYWKGGKLKLKVMIAGINATVRATLGYWRDIGIVVIAAHL